MTTTAELEAVRGHCIGSERLYRETLIGGKRNIYTEGVKAHIETADSFFLLTDILAVMATKLTPEQKKFCLVELWVNPEGRDIKTIRGSGKRVMSPSTRQITTVDERVMWEGVEFDSRDDVYKHEGLLTIRNDTGTTPYYHQKYLICSHPKGHWKFYIRSGLIRLEGCMELADEGYPNMAEGYTLMLPSEY